MSGDFFDQIIGRGGVPRDDSGNALIARRDDPNVLEPYTPASALADFVEYQGHLHTWEKRYLARGMGVSPDLCLLAAAEPYSTGITDGMVGPEKTASGRRLDEIIERALDRVKIHEKADYGTAVHAWTEPEHPGPVDPRAQADVDSFWKCVKDHGIRIVATEVFTVNDELQAAGTFDHLMWVPGLGIVVADKKTGRTNYHAHGVQLSTYANGEVYHAQTREREPLDSLLKDEYDALNTQIGLIFQIKNGKTKILPVDLRAGWEGAKTAARVRDYRSERLALPDVLTTITASAESERESLLTALNTLPDPTREAFAAFWREHEHLWDERHTAAVTARLEEAA